MKTRLDNIFEIVLAQAARVREINEARHAAIEMGTYELNQYKKQQRACDMASGEIESGTVGVDYLRKAVSKTQKRNRDYNKSKRR